MTGRLAEGEPVFVTHLHDAEPVYHSWRRDRGGLANDRSECGLDRVRAYLVTMPKVHAERFARPCRRCWRSP